MIQPDAESLNNIGVLVTRPSHQAGPFLNLLKKHGADPISFPAIEIQPSEFTDELKQILNQLNKFDILVFISANAVEHAINLLENSSEKINHPVAAIGQSTAATLDRHGIKVSIQPESGYNSEALLNSQSLQKNQVKGKRILIFRGEGGRELLADTLRERGAEVTYAQVYRRVVPSSDIKSVVNKWKQGRIQLVTVTSNETLKNLYHMLDKTGQDYLIKTSLVVASKRCAELARQLGFKSQVLTAANATDQAMLDTILDWQRQ